MKKVINQAYIILIGAASLFGACNKDHTESAIPAGEGSLRQSGYLKVKDANELTNLITRVSRMTDDEYARWKVSAGLTRSLYDRFIELENKLLASDSKTVPAQDSSFFYFNNGHLVSKGGLLDRVVNDFGLIQVNDLVVRYQGGNVFYAAEKSEEKNILMNSDATATELFQKTQNYIKDNSHTAARGVTMYPTEVKNYSTSVMLFTALNTLTPKRKHWADLMEDHVIIPSSGTSYVTWHVQHKLYYHFTQQKKVVFTWNRYPARTKGYIGFGSAGLPVWPYTPGSFFGYAYNVSDNTGWPAGQTYSPNPPVMWGGAEAYFETPGNDGHTYFQIYDGTKPDAVSGYLGSPLEVQTPSLNIGIRSYVFDVVLPNGLAVYIR